MGKPLKNMLAIAPCNSGGASLTSSGRFYSSTAISHLGFEMFYDVKEKADDLVVTGRAWTVADLRRKSFDDLHKLWFILYKERNLVLTERERVRRIQRPLSKLEDNRYIKVKRSMAAIKVVLKERSKIRKMLDIDAKVEGEGEFDDVVLADSKPASHRAENNGSLSK